MVRGVDTNAAVLPLRRTDSNQPDAGRLIVALRQIGYSLEQAVADLIDNSINAGAKNVLLRFLHDGEAIRAIAIVDDGDGMDGEELADAMRFGSREKNDPRTLGKFGMGMKLASMSHARTMTVYSNKSGRSNARRWTLEGISSGWWCERVSGGAADAMLSRRWGSLDLSGGGTIVLWEDIDRLPSHRRGLRSTLSSLERRLRLHLGICFHRFMETGRLRVWLDQAQVDRVGQGLQSELTALNPFGYSSPGHESFPKVLKAELSDIGPLTLECHIWPAHQESAEYRLGRKASARQGFYFYRNGRLIQTGGWNGLVGDETEPHSSLARVAVDLPIEYDSWFGINVQKSNVLVPPVFTDVLAASASDGTTFEDYRRSAVEVYRSSNRKQTFASPFPSKGIGRAAAEKARALYGRGHENDGFSVRWRTLPREQFFKVDTDGGELLMNSRYRSTLSKNTFTERALKLVLALLTRKDFHKAPNEKRQQELSAVNAMLIELVSDE